jgi:uncharacterized protein (DUF302 family)
MKNHHFLFRVLLAALLLLGTASLAHGDENPALWKHQVKGDFATVLADLKAGLEARQFQISGEENMSKGLENNIAVFGADKWNSIGFDNVTVVHFCSLVFNHEVYNLNMDLAILCPFKAVVYNMKSEPDRVHIMTVRPGYLVARDPHPDTRDVGKRIEDEIISAIEDAVR